MKLRAISWLRSKGLVGVCAVTSGLAGMAWAQAQAVSTTTVQGTVYLANGQPAGGTLVVSWPTFTTAAGQLVSEGQTTVTVGADGYVSVNLAPNQGATPAGEYYTAVFYKSDGTVSTWYWTVPAAAQASLAQVQAQVMPSAQAVQAVSKAYVDQAVSQALGSQLSASGGNLTGPLYLSGDPSQPLQAADKHYVDSSLSAALPLSGGTVTGPANFSAAVNFGSTVTASSGIGFTGTGAAQTLTNLLPGAASDSANGMTLKGTSAPNTMAPKVSPVADIRANGAVIDGATDISSALQTSINQCNASNGNACTVLLPCTGPNGCYLANGSSITWSPSGSKILHIKQQGTLYLGSTFVMPQYTSWTCDAGGGVAQFQGSGANCAVYGKTTVAGTLGTAVTTTGGAVTFTPTYTSGSASNFNVNSAITVAGLQTCSATASRTSAASGQNTVFTLSSCTDSSGNAETGPRTPVGSTLTVTGCSDATFNITGAPVAAQDWPNNTETIYESGATSTATGCTVKGFDDNTFENVRITAVSGGTFTATFAHKHAASDLWGMVTVAPLSNTFTHHEINGLTINSMGGASGWFDNMAQVNLSDDAFQPNGGNGIAAEGIACTGCWWGTWNRDSFLANVPSQHCTSNCSVGYPWGIHFSQDAARSNGIGGGFIQISNSTIMAGIKVDGNGLNNSSGEGPQIGTLSNDVFEQTNSGAVTVDPRTNLGGPVSVSMNYDTLQDDFQNNNQYFVFGTDCCVVGFADIGDLTSFALQYGATAQGYLANAYWPKGVAARGVGTMHNPAAIGNATGLLTDGNTLLGNFAGANAGMAPNIVPQATLPLTLNPTCATCIAVKGPDGVANSATEVQTSSAGAHESVVLGTTSVGTYAGDSIIFGAYCRPGAGENTWGSASGANWMMDLYTFGTDTFLNNTASGYTNPAAAGAAIPLTNGTWQKCFAVAQIATGESTAHTLRFQIDSPGSGNSVGNDFYDPFWLFVAGPNNPSYAGVTQAEAVRWAEEMFKGYVPSGASTGKLYGNYPLALQLSTASISGSSGTATCVQSSQGTVKQASCYLNGYAQTGSAQTYSFPTAFSATPVLLESGGSCGTYNPTATATTLTLPANAAMTAETCNVVAIGQ